jgi:hypothetical protein
MVRMRAGESLVGAGEETVVLGGRSLVTIENGGLLMKQHHRWRFNKSPGKSLARLRRSLG